MAAKNFFEEHLPKAVVALLLTFAAGLVDIVGYVGVFHFFTAHLTGTSVQLGHGLANRDWVNVCAAAVEALGEIADASAEPPLLRCAERFPNDPFLGFAIKIVAERLHGLTLSPRG